MDDEPFRVRLAMFLRNKWNVVAGADRAMELGRANTLRGDYFSSGAADSSDKRG
jgi:hypothetical protein